MKIVSLYFKDDKLGELTYDGKYYIYNSNIVGEVKVKKYPSFLLYQLENSKNRKSTTLFSVFDEFRRNIINRRDILTRMGYEDGDDDFTLLYKYGHLSQNDFKYHLVSEG